MNNQTFSRQANSLGIFFVILFAVCFLWFYFRGGDAEIKQLHDNLFALGFFGWRGMNLVSFILGAIQSFIWGYIALALWQLAAKLTSQR